jgi:hypothetical protein
MLIKQGSLAQKNSLLTSRSQLFPMKFKIRFDIQTHSFENFLEQKMEDENYSNSNSNSFQLLPFKNNYQILDN